MDKEETFEKAIDMIEDFAIANNLVIIGTIMMDDPEGRSVVRQINTDPSAHGQP